MQPEQTSASILNSWLQEKESAYLYRVLVERTVDQAQQRLFSQLAEEAEEQAGIWAVTFQQKTQQAVPAFQPRRRVKIIKVLIIWFGPERIRTILSATKVRGMSIYNLSIGHPMPEHISDVGQRHQSSGAGNNIRASLFGINDGLVSNTSLILGMAGGGALHNTILLAGIAGLLAGAFSMAAGEFISVRSQREMLEYQIEQERKELELYPAEEAAELALIYQARGLGKTDAENAANTIIQNPENALNTLAREELGLDPGNLVSPYGAALSSFLSFMIGAGVPLLPFMLHPSINTIPVTIILSAIALFIVGAVLSLFTGRNAIKNGLRMLSIGALAGVLTYLIGYGISQGLR
ncbi:MAG: VIT1/CCC1 transporter family protein [Gammaproteobacteria bacterium]